MTINHIVSIDHGSYDVYWESQTSSQFLQEPQKIAKAMCFPCSFPYKPVASVAIGIFFWDQKNGSGTSKFDDKRPITLW